MFWQLALVAAACAAYYRWSRQRLYRLAEEISSGVKCYPIVGHAYKFIGSGQDRLKAIQEFGRIANRQGGLSSVWLGNTLFICMTDPEAIAAVTKACLDKDAFTMKFMSMVFANGTIFAPVNIWHSRRKIMAPFFRLQNLKQAVTVFEEQSRVMADLMQSEVGRGDFSMWKYMTSYILDTKLETVLGIKLKSQENPDNFMLRAVYEMMEMVLARILKPWYHPDCVYERTPVCKQFLDHKKRAFDFIDKVDSSEDGFSKFMDVIVESSEREAKGYSDLELREELIGIIVAGNDTYSVSSCFTAVLLSRYPEVQDKVFQELQEVFGDSDRAITAEDLPRLKYLEAVIKESLRLYPPAAIIMREVHSDVVLPSGTTLVPGTSVVINIWAAHRNPIYWGKDAELFRPERFLQGALRHSATYLPFSYSLRGCVGPTYAMLSMKTALANLVRRYRLLPPTGARAADPTQPLPLPLKLDIMMKAVDNFVVRVEKRN